MEHVDDDSALHLALFLLPKDTSHFLNSCSSNASLADAGRIWRQKLRALKGNECAYDYGETSQWKRAYWTAYYENISGTLLRHACDDDMDDNEEMDMRSFGIGTLHVTTLNEDFVLTTDEDGRNKLWDIHTGHCISQFAPESNAYRAIVKDVVFVDRMTDTSFVVAGNQGWDGKLTIWGDAGTNPYMQASFWIQNRVRVVEKMGDCVLTGSEDTTVRLFNPYSLKCLAIFRGHYGTIRALRRRDDTTFFSGSSDGTVQLWDVVSGQRIHCYKISTSAAIVGIEVIDSDTFIVATTINIQIFDVATGYRLKSFNHQHFGRQGSISCIAVISPRILVTGERNYHVFSSEQNTIKVFDLALGKCIQSYHHESFDDTQQQSVCSIARINSSLFVAGYEDGTAQLWSVPRVC